MTDRQRMWDERYAASDRVWSAGPNAEVERIVGGWKPDRTAQGGRGGRALDLGAGEGRHAVWLASLGWRVTAVDFSPVGLGKGEAEATRRALRVDWVVADARSWQPPEGVLFDLVLVAYLHLPEDVLSRTTRWLAPGGALVVVGHALRNLTEGVGGPSDPSLLHTLEELRVASAGLSVERCEEIVRPTEGGDAIDAVLVARRPAD
ncbi:bifunctional 2-polyprenyl-6-hydroxyphenol methylase/3-demethylubiquinol 3-O-methyltransferase UbiG [Phycicoccus sp. Root101]|uniref:class I SAM-dependent methyltransferase n=1 Tax=Phycicoccus sp. Root101 TaxID=1736421 RepID=UPI000B112DD0|nr:class I SAM-dependent methyltransferase [Phycicoccus sp. Root101]